MNKTPQEAMDQARVAYALLLQIGKLMADGLDKAGPGVDRVVATVGQWGAICAFADHARECAALDGLSRHVEDVAAGLRPLLPSPLPKGGNA